MEKKYYTKQQILEDKQPLNEEGWFTLENTLMALGFVPVIGEIADYIFNQLGCVRVTARTQPDNTKARRMLESLGFKCEGIIRQGYGTKDMMVYGILQNEAMRWMKRKEEAMV